jgi:hypothetical protein
MTMQLGAFLAPLDDVTFPNGVTCAARRLDADGWKLLREYEAEPTNAAKGLALLRWIVPDATDAEWETLDEGGIIGTQIIAHARGRLQYVQTLLKNGVAGGAEVAASPPRPSSPTTKRITSSAASRKRSAPTGGPSTSSRTS